eukprot:304006_1
MSLVRAPLTDTDSESDRERDEPSNNNNDRNVNNSNSHVPISPVAIVQASNARKRTREKYDDTFILKTMSNAFKHFAAHHGKHFDHKHQFMLFYENCRVFDPSYRNKPATVDIATQHIPWGYDCYRKKPAIQKALSKDYERYLRNTRDIVDKPKYLKHWWKSNEREYKYLSVIALRCLNALRGGCAVERSFNHFSKMNRSGNAATMGPLNKEVRTMCHWNKELIANGLFDLTSL